MKLNFGTLDVDTSYQVLNSPATIDGSFASYTKFALDSGCHSVATAALGPGSECWDGNKLDEVKLLGMLVSYGFILFHFNPSLAVGWKREILQVTKLSGFASEKTWV